jgi:hypothetical protein
MIHILFNLVCSPLGSSSRGQDAKINQQVNEFLWNQGTNEGVQKVEQFKDINLGEEISEG